MNKVSTCAEINYSSSDNLRFAQEGVNIGIWILKTTVRKLLLSSLGSCNAALLCLLHVRHLLGYYVSTLRGLSILNVYTFEMECGHLHIRKICYTYNEAHFSQPKSLIFRQITSQLYPICICKFLPRGHILFKLTLAWLESVERVNFIHKIPSCTSVINDFIRSRIMWLKTVMGTVWPLT